MARLSSPQAWLLAELAPHDGQLRRVDNDFCDDSWAFVAAHFPRVISHQTGANLGGAGGFPAGMRIALASQPAPRVHLAARPRYRGRSPGLDAIVRMSAGTTNRRRCRFADLSIRQARHGAGNWRALHPPLGRLQQHPCGQPRLAPTITPWPADYLAACSVLIKRAGLAEVGTFADLFIFYDDVEWGLRVQQ